MWRARVNDIRWFASTPYARLLVPELRRRGLRIALEGDGPARVAIAMSGRMAERAWRYARLRRVALVIYIWDIPPRHTGNGLYDPVWCVGNRLFRLPRPFGGYRVRRGLYSRQRYVAARADAIWVPSNLTRDMLVDRFGLVGSKVPYCYDSERFQLSEAGREEPPTLLTVSRLEPYKNQPAVLRAAARCRREVQVRLIGRGAESRNLASLAALLGVRCSIQTDASDAMVTQAYQSASVVVCPSRFEGFGLTPVEGVASGVPVVASEIPPHREFVGAAARFFPLEDDTALVNAIEAALDGDRPDPGLVQDLTIPAAGQRFLSGLSPFLG